MPRFLTKTKLELLILAFLIVGMIMVAGNIALAVKRPDVEKSVNQLFSYDVAVGSVHYIFPNKIIFNNINFRDPDLSGGNPPFTLPVVIMRFSILEALAGKVFRVSKVELESLNVNYYAVNQFFEENYDAILEIVKNSPGNDIAVNIKEALLDFDRTGRPDYITMELRLTIQDGVLDGTGYFRADQYRFIPGGGRPEILAKGWPLWYRLKSHLRHNGLDIDQLIFKSGVIDSKLWGSIRSGLVKMNGFVLLNTAKKDFNAEEYASTNFFYDFPEADQLSSIDTYILDLDAEIGLALPEIDIQKLDFNLNNIPVQLQGAVSLKDKFSMSGAMSLFGGEASGGKNLLFDRTDVHFSGDWVNNRLNFDGRADIDFIDSEQRTFAPERGVVDFSGLAYYFDAQKQSHVDLDRAEITYWRQEREHKLVFAQLATKTNARSEGYKVISINAPFYDGSLSGEVQVDSTGLHSKITSDMTLNNVDTAALEELAVQFAKFNGRMSSQMKFTNTPQVDLSGEITIYDGTLTDLTFLNWLSDSFRLPELKAVDFDRAMAGFTMNKEHVKLEDVSLNADDLRISGYFTIDARSLVTSKLSLDLSQDLLGRSVKFRPALKMFTDGPDFLDFDFQLSGNLSTMNFRWLPSDTKQKIQKRIPDFVERMIEHNIDAMMQPD